MRTKNREQLNELLVALSPDFDPSDVRQALKKIRG